MRSPEYEVVHIVRGGWCQQTCQEVSIGLEPQDDGAAMCYGLQAYADGHHIIIYQTFLHGRGGSCREVGSQSQLHGVGLGS